LVTSLTYIKFIFNQCFHLANSSFRWHRFLNDTGNPEGLGTELLETLVKMALTKEEEIKLKNYDGDLSRLGSAERFLKAVLDIPLAFKRIEAMLYRANFETEVNYLRKSFQTLEVYYIHPYLYSMSCFQLHFVLPLYKLINQRFTFTRLQVRN